MIKVHYKEAVIDMLEKEEVLAEGETPIWKQGIRKGLMKKIPGLVG